jgi:hypothetical protein
MGYLQDNIEKYRRVEEELTELQKTRRLTEVEFFRLNRAMDIQQAARLGLQHALYLGGSVEDTGEFCRNRNKKVFTIEEILEWKYEAHRPRMENYDPFLDLGGNCCHPDQEHCQHRLNYITKELAKSHSS